MTEIQRNDPNRIPPDEPTAIARVEQHEPKHPVQLVHQVLAMGSVQGQDDFAIASGHKRVVSTFGTQGFVIVNLSVDSEGHIGFGVDQGLGATGDVDDGEALVGENRLIVLKDATPVRAAVALGLGDLQSELAVGVSGRRQSEQGGDGTHGCGLRNCGHTGCGFRRDFADFFRILSCRN